MIDNLAILLTHTLIAVAMWRLVSRADLDREPPAGEPAEPAPPPQRKGRRRA